MAVRDLKNWLDKHSYRIDEEASTNIDYYEEDEEHEDGHQGILNRMEVIDACHESTFEQNKKEKIEDFLSDKEEEIKNIIKEGLTEDEDFQEEVKKEFESYFDEYRTPDDYAPIWLTCWKFPSNYSAEKLNQEDISGIVFWEMENITFVGLTTCGMDMSPAVEYAYFMYSDLDISKSYVKQKALRQPSYFSYVIGNSDFLKLCEKVGITKKKVELAEKRVHERIKDFDKQLNKLTELRDSGKISQSEAGLLGLITYFKSEKETEEKVKVMAK